MSQYRNEDQRRLYDLMRMVISAQRVEHPYIADTSTAWEHLDHVVIAFVEEFTQIRDFGMLSELLPPRILFSVARGEKYGGFKTNPSRYGQPIYSDEPDKLTDPQIFSLWQSTMRRGFRGKPQFLNAFDETWKELPESTIEFAIIRLWSEIMGEEEKKDDSKSDTCTG